MKKFLSMLMAFIMVFGLFAGVNTAVEAEGETSLIYGSTTEISGDWSFGAYWTNNATDNMIRGLINDYGTVAQERDGSYLINEQVVETYETEENEDGTKTFTMKIHEDLVFNDGTPITAEHYVAGILYFANPTLVSLGSKSSAHLYYEGGPAYQSGESEVWTGIRLLDEYTFSLQATAEKLPHFYEMSFFASAGPFPIHVWTAEGTSVKDDGEGCYWDGDMSVETIEPIVEFARFNSENRVSAGPYNLVSFDQGSKQAVLEINPSYKGTFDGQKPSIDKLIIVKAEDATMIDALRTGEIEILPAMNGGDRINAGLDLVAEGGFAYNSFPRAGYGKLMFQCDFGPTQFVNVRHAIAHLLDRYEFANKFTGGYGSVVNGPYGLAQWQYQEAEEELEELNEYTFDVDTAIQLLEEDGWVLDAEGNEYKEGVRYKEVTPEEAGEYPHNVTVGDKILMPLIIEWSSTENNPVSELLATMLAEATAPQAGMEIRQNIMTFSELLNWMYRDSSVDERYGVPTYGLYNLASNFYPNSTFENSFTTDPDEVAKGWNVNFLLNEDLNALGKKMATGVEPGDNEAFLEVWVDFMVLWNELLPEIPLYSDEYYSFFIDTLENYEDSAFWGFGRAILYANIAE